MMSISCVWCTQFFFYYFILSFHFQNSMPTCHQLILTILTIWNNFGIIEIKAIYKVTIFIVEWTAADKKRGPGIWCQLQSTLIVSWICWRLLNDKCGTKAIVWNKMEWGGVIRFHGHNHHKCNPYTQSILNPDMNIVKK